MDGCMSMKKVDGRTKKEKEKEMDRCMSMKKKYSGRTKKKKKEREMDGFLSMKKWTDTPKKKRNGMHVHEKKKEKKIACP